ncbi:YvrJ family protein [Kurthia senegalensis]|nr:YvrJ family protein [Kurthia senegalensis]
MGEFINLLDYGFPVAIAIYLLVRMENKLQQLTDAIKNLSKKDA